ncbi:MAG: FAD-dependent thymidylate synthase [Acidimicrobiales bacterium]
MHPYVVENFSPDEADVLRRYFTNLDRPVFALVNLPEVVKGALFARYSRSAKSLRRLFLDEFVGDLDISGDHSVDATVGLARAEQLYARVFYEYGDDSVAQLGGVHLACEEASNLLTKILERGRLMSYMEKSTRYVGYDTRLDNGRYRYFRDPAILDSPLGARYVGEMDRMFDSYAELLPVMHAHFSEAFPRQAGDSDFVHRQAIRAKALDAVRGLLPAASLSNLGIYGTGQGYEQLLIRMRAHPLPEARDYAGMMLEELRKVIPSFVRRVDVDDRGVAWSRYMEENRGAMQALADELLLTENQAERPLVSLVDFDPRGEEKVLSAMLYAFSDLPEDKLAERVARLGPEDRARLVQTYVGERGNRRHRPGRALERTDYRFDVLSDYGAFRDLQRHRLLPNDGQSLGPDHGYAVPAEVSDAGEEAEESYRQSMERSAELYADLADDFPEQASYAIALGYRVRYAMQMNAREAMHVLELRSGPQGHPGYRAVVQEMHRLIADEAGHRALAGAMGYVDHSEVALERLESERRAEARRQLDKV